MRTRPRRGALGLRGRIVGAVLVTTVATLGVAALALLGPLEQKLRDAAQTTLQRDIGKHPTRPFTQLNLGNLSKPYDVDELQQREQDLATRAGGFAYVLGYPGPNGVGSVPQAPPPSEARHAGTDSFDDVAAAFRTNRKQMTFGSIGGTEYARLALPFMSGGKWFVLNAVGRAVKKAPPTTTTGTTTNSTDTTCTAYVCP